VRIFQDAYGLPRAQPHERQKARTEFQIWGAWDGEKDDPAARQADSGGSLATRDLQGAELASRPVDKARWCGDDEHLIQLRVDSWAS